MALDNENVKAGEPDKGQDRLLWVRPEIRPSGDQTGAQDGHSHHFVPLVDVLAQLPDRNITLVLTRPPYLIAGFFSIAVSLTSGRYNERTWHITGCKLFAVLGFVIAPATLNVGARYAAMVIFTIGTYVRFRFRHSGAGVH